MSYAWTGAKLSDRAPADHINPPYNCRNYYKFRDEYVDLPFAEHTYKAPARLRPATEADIFAGAILWDADYWKGEFTNWHWEKVGVDQGQGNFSNLDGDNFCLQFGNYFVETDGPDQVSDRHIHWRPK